MSDRSTPERRVGDSSLGRSAEPAGQGRLWHNWPGNHSWRPRTVLEPATGVALRHAVGDAVRTGRRIKPVGERHSLNDIAAADDILLQLRGWTGMVAHDAGRRQVTVRSGTRLWQLPPILEPLGLAMPNLGDIDRQSIAGAIATGTHGTGLQLAGLASQVVGLTMIDGRGEELTITEDDPDLLNACRIGLGALGVVTEVTLQCVPAFDLHVVERREALDDVLGDWEARLAGADHFEFFWFPATDEVITSSRDRVDRDVEVRSPRTSRIGDLLRAEVLDNAALAVMCEVGRFAPDAVPVLNRIATAAWTLRDRTDRSDLVLTSTRRVKFQEMEYAFAVADVPQVLADLRVRLARDGVKVTFPIEVRAAAADDAWLSTAHGRPTGYVAVHQYARQDAEDYFTGCAEVFDAHDGRPHWGKHHALTADELAPKYPRMVDFLALRDRHDPDRLFTNDHLDRVLGHRP
ncbi:D-arabinono-1,4-lactone oxidase [Microlunatus sp. Y2014]|uniref:D-arabinono-1,4-lactone oxidase n=1 Tax=Microlunatus sp. Y2014 TaxID=3418488 RepID=UPI003DA72395